MTADPRAGAETIHPPVEEFDQWCRDHPNRAHLVPLGYWNGGYRAGWQARGAHAPAAPALASVQALRTAVIFLLDHIADEIQPTTGDTLDQYVQPVRKALEAIDAHG